MSNALPDLRHLASIVEFSEDAIIGTTLDLTVVSWNASAERLFGYTASDMIGKSMTLLVPPERQAEEENFHRKLRAAQAPGHYEAERVRKDGNHVYVSLT